MKKDERREIKFCIRHSMHYQQWCPKCKREVEVRHKPWCAWSLIRGVCNCGASEK